MTTKAARFRSFGFCRLCWKTKTKNLLLHYCCTMNVIEVLSDSSDTIIQDDEYNPIEELDVLQKLAEKYRPVLEDNLPNVKTSTCVNSQSTTSKEEKGRERERKKTEKEREKLLRKTLTAANKNLKPGECMKFICVHIDNEIINSDSGKEILNILQASDVKYKVESQIFPNTITWSRSIQSHSMDDKDELVLLSQNQEANEILFIMNCKEFVEQISNNSLTSHIESLKSVLSNKKITVAVFGLQNYLKYRNNQKQSEYRAQVSNESTKQAKDSKTYKDFPQVSRKNIETALTELQILCNCSHRLIQTPSEMGLMVAQFTKSVAELPYKLEKQVKFQQTEWFVAGDNKDCVKVDKDGNGLHRLYKQMLTTFPLASLETAEAIVAKYPTMALLMEAYEKCNSAQEAETLLKDIPVRRAAGPLSSARKIGPELSKKVYNCFTSLEGDALL